MLTPARMAEIAAACWPDRSDRWTAESIETMLAQDSTFAVCRADGFAVVRHSPFDAELLSLDVLPEQQGRGVGGDILTEAMAHAHDLGAETFFLEVDIDNLPALKLYDRAGFFVVGRRKAYYRKPDGAWADAHVMAHYFGAEDLIGASGRRRLSI
jgi:ribosomal-protein-alanine N-acetyltransferase